MRQPADSISCRIFASFFNQLAAENIELEEIFAGLPFGDAHLRDPSNSISWQEFLDLQHALAKTLGGVDEFEEFAARG